MDTGLETKRENAMKVIRCITEHSPMSAEILLAYSHQVEHDRAYYKGKCEQYEKHLSSHGHGEVSFMQNGNRILHAVAPPREKRGVGVVKDLTRPPRPLGPGPVEVDGEPESALDAPSMQSGELFSCANGDKARGWHGPPGERMLSPEYLTNMLSEVHRECEDAIFAESDRVMKALQNNDFAKLADVMCEWKLAAVECMRSKIMEKIFA